MIMTIQALANIVVFLIGFIVAVSIARNVRHREGYVLRRFIEHEYLTMGRMSTYQYDILRAQAYRLQGVEPINIVEPARQTKTTKLDHYVSIRELDLNGWPQSFLYSTFQHMLVQFCRHGAQRPTVLRLTLMEDTGAHPQNR